MAKNILGLKLKSYREENKLTQAELAELLEVSDKTISKWELGQTYPSKRNMLKISEQVGLDLEVLLIEEKAIDTSWIRYGVIFSILAYALNYVILLFLKLVNSQSLVLAIPVSIVIGFSYAYFILPKKDKM